MHSHPSGLTKSTHMPLPEDDLICRGAQTRLKCPMPIPLYVKWKIEQTLLYNRTGRVSINAPPHMEASIVHFAHAKASKTQSASSFMCCFDHLAATSLEAVSSQNVRYYLYEVLQTEEPVTSLPSLLFAPHDNQTKPRALNSCRTNGTFGP